MLYIYHYFSIGLGYTYEQWQVVGVDDVLVLRYEYPPRLLEQLLVRPVTVHQEQLITQQVVFTQEDRMNDGQRRLLVYSWIS